jgi:photosystem II stability/assembly factor-like uncharacterized protein
MFAVNRYKKRPLRFFLALISFVCVIIHHALPAYGWAVQALSLEAAQALLSEEPSSALSPALSKADDKTAEHIKTAYGKLPLSFEANQGQADAAVEFIAHASGYTLALSRREAVVNLHTTSGLGLADERATGSLPDRQPQTRTAQTTALRMKLVNSNAAALEGINQLAGKSNYLTGNDARQWVTGVANYAAVRQQNVYRGIEVIYYGNQQELEYDFKVAPGANPKAIAIAFEGVRGMRIDANGDLVLGTAAGVLRQRKPFVYQETDGVKTQVAGRYEIKGKHRVGFRVGAYDRRKPLVIDPVLSYSTTFNGEIADVKVDAAGNAYVTGFTTPGSLTPTSGAAQLSGAGESEAFVAKLNAAGSSLLYSTFLGGSGSDIAGGIAVDGQGNAYVAGTTSSKDFPTTPGAFQTIHSNLSNPSDTAEFFPYEAFIVKLNATGAALLYSTYLGSRGNQSANSIAIDTAGNAYVTGATGGSNSFPTTPGVFQPNRATGAAGDTFGTDAYVTKLNASGTGLVYSSFLGGTSFIDTGYSIAVDAQGNAYVTGATSSTNFPTTAGAFQTVAPTGSLNAFVTKVNATASALIYSTYLGGKGSDSAYAIAIDTAGNAYVTGTTASIDFPVANASQASLGSSPTIKSTNGGARFLPIHGDLPRLADGFGGKPYFIVADPNSTATLYLANSGGLFKTVNGGSSWNQQDFPTSTPLSLAIVSGNSSTLYAGHRGLYKSTDGGASWTQTGLNQSDTTQVRAVVIDPQNASTVYALITRQLSFATFAEPLVKSTDGGNTWVDVNISPENPAVKSFVINPVSSSTLYAGTSKGLFKSVNGGTSWSSTPVSKVAFALAIDPGDPSTIYAGTRFDEPRVLSDDGRGIPRRRVSSAQGALDGLMRSRDGGVTWSSVNAGLEEADDSAYVIAFDPNPPHTIYIGNDAGLFKSNNGGNNWVPTEVVSTITSVLAIDPAGSVYAGLTPGFDAFVTQLNANGSGLLFSTYLGGLLVDEGKGIAVDASADVYVTGVTQSGNFPTTPGALRNNRGGSGDAFVVKFDLANAKLQSSTYLGGNDSDEGARIAVDAAGNAYVVGRTLSNNFPLRHPIQTGPNSAGLADSGFISKVDSSASTPPTPPGPEITAASVSGKKLFITGQSFSPGAVILMNGQEQATTSDAESPTTRVISKKAGKKVIPGQTVMLQLRNADGTMSNEFPYTRPNP